ncbi:MAG: hypothetical protein J3K34DRAFT_408151 [Monoraphidium minutum]|nr:MAG: hypothetical protein J3K34DRAFT_408151 [Monoraphidium minutum]
MFGTIFLFFLHPLPAATGRARAAARAASPPANPLVRRRRCPIGWGGRGTHALARARPRAARGAPTAALRPAAAAAPLVWACALRAPAHTSLPSAPPRCLSWYAQDMV